MVIKLKRSSLILLLCLTIVILILGAAAYHYSNLINIDNEQDIISVINEKSGNTDDDIFYEMVLKNDYAALFYQTKNNDNYILILEKDPIFSLRYTYFGHTVTDETHDIYNFTTRRERHTKYLYAVSVNSLEEYDNNSIYLKITQNNKETGKSKLITNEAIENTPYYELFVEDFYDDTAYYFECSLYDKNGEIIF